jgi:hypothetical protein
MKKVGLTIILLFFTFLQISAQEKYYDNKEIFKPLASFRNLAEKSQLRVCNWK